LNKNFRNIRSQNQERRQKNFQGGPMEKKSEK